MVQRKLKSLSLIASLLLLAACSTAPNQSNGKATEPDLVQAVTQFGANAYGDNVMRSPALVADASGKTIDKQFMRTQADYHFTLAEAYALDGDATRAIEEYKLVLVYDTHSATVRMKLAAELVKKGILVEAVDQAETAVSIDPNLIDARLLLAGLYSSSKLYDKALEQYQKVSEIDPDNIEAALYVGAILAEEKKYDESIKHFKKVALNKKHAHLAYYYWGRIELERKHDKEAEVALKKSLEAKPDFIETVVALGYLYEQDNKTDAAVKLYRDYQEKYGPSSKIASSLGRIYMERDLYEDAYRQFEIISEQDGENLNIKVKMALILIEQKKYDTAISKLKEILAQAPDAEKIRFYLAAVYEEIKAYPEAIEQFTTIKPTSTLYNEATVHTAYLQKLQSNYGAAMATMASAIGKRADIPQFYSFYASLLDEQKMPSKAVSILENAVQRFPKDDQLFFYLGSMQDKAGARQASISSMRKVLELNPDHIQALNYLGYTLTEMGQNLDEAESLIRRALKLKPNDGYITDSLGWVLYKRGDTKEAIAVLEGAYKLKPDESIIAEHLGDAYLTYSLREKARQMYIRAVTLESDETNIVKIKQKIANIDSAISQSASVPAPDENKAAVRAPASDEEAQ